MRAHASPSQSNPPPLRQDQPKMTDRYANSCRILARNGRQIAYCAQHTTRTHTPRWRLDRVMIVREALGYPLSGNLYLPRERRTDGGVGLGFGCGSCLRWLLVYLYFGGLRIWSSPVGFKQKSGRAEGKAQLSHASMQYSTTGTSRVRRRGEAGTKLQWSDRLPLANSAAPQQALSIAQHNSLLWFFFSSNCGPSSASLTVRSPATPPYANLRAPPPVAQTRKAHPHPRAPALVASGGTTTFF